MGAQRWMAYAMAMLIAAGMASEGEAQAITGASLGAGLGFPTGHLGETHETGYLGRASLFVFPRSERLGLRADVGYGAFSAGDESSGTDFEPLTFMANLVLNLAPRGRWHPYLLAGGGVMRNGSTAGAIQGGAGLSAGEGRTRAFLEGLLITNIKPLQGAEYAALIAGVSLRFR